MRKYRIFKYKENTNSITLEDLLNNDWKFERGGRIYECLQYRY